MQFSFQATGEISDGSRDELEKAARKFVKSLPGVTGAWFQGTDGGEAFSINVREDKPKEAKGDEE